MSVPQIYQRVYLQQPAAGVVRHTYDLGAMLSISERLSDKESGHFNADVYEAVLRREGRQRYRYSSVEPAAENRLTGSLNQMPRSELQNLSFCRYTVSPGNFDLLPLHATSDVRSQTYSFSKSGKKLASSKTPYAVVAASYRRSGYFFGRVRATDGDVVEQALEFPRETISTRARLVFQCK